MADVVICTASRSEKALQAPLIEAFGNRCEVLEVPCDFKQAYDKTEKYIMSHGVYDATGSPMVFDGLPKVAFCSFDRPEMLGVALSFWFHGIDICQYHAGDCADVHVCFDDSIRHMITLMSKYQFCNGADAHMRCIKLLKLVGKDIKNCFNVGSVGLPKLDYSFVPDCKFDVVLYNSPNNAQSELASDLQTIMNMLDKYTIWITPNEDLGRDVIIKCIENLKYRDVVGVDTLPRAQFLALLQKADRVIGNSSCFFHELPLLNRGHVHVGNRNRGRNYVLNNGDTDAAKKMADIVLGDIDGR